jgi:hypothetical protein
MPSMKSISKSPNLGNLLVEALKTAILMGSAEPAAHAEFANEPHSISKIMKTPTFFMLAPSELTINRHSSFKFYLHPNLGFTAYTSYFIFHRFKLAFIPMYKVSDRMKGSVIVRFGAVRLMRMSMRVLMNMLGVLSDD